MTSYPLPVKRLQQLLCVCIYAVLLCAFFGAADDTRAQSKDDVCAALDMSTADCARITSIPDRVFSPNLSTRIFNLTGRALRYSEFPWTVVSEVKTRGSTSLRSRGIGNSHGSCLILSIALPVGSEIRFSLRTSSQGGADHLIFAVDANILISDFSAAAGSVVRDWEESEHILSNSISKLTWCYLKDNGTSAGEDAGWLDGLSFTVPLIKSQICPALDMSSADCGRITGVLTTLPTGLTLPQEGASATAFTNIPWLVSSVRTEGTTSLRSGTVSDAQGSCLILRVSVPANTRINFSLRTSSQGRYDRLAFFINNQTEIANFSAPEGSVTKDWMSIERLLTGNVSNLSWCYLKNGGDNMQGDDAGWLDNLSFTPPSPVCPILDMSEAECLLITGTRYEPSGATWTASNIAVEGDNSLQSPDIELNDGQQSCLILNVSLPDRTLVQFFRRVSSQPGDELYFSVDDVRQEYHLRPAATTGSESWSREVHILFESGDKVLRWCYVKDASGGEGENRAWIDDLSLVAPPAAPLNRDLTCLVLDMSLADCELITSYASEPADPPWYISYYNSEGEAGNGETSLRSDPEVDHNETSCLVLGVALTGDRIVQFFPRTNSEGVNDFLYFAADGIRLIENYSAALGESFRDFEGVNVFLSGSVRTLSWCYTKNGSGDAGGDSVWLDRLSFSAVGDPSNIPLTRGLLCLVLDMSAEECDLITSVTADPPAVPWVLSTTATEGGTSLRSGDIDDDQTSCLVVGITLPDDRNLRFSLRTDSESVNDFLFFEVGGTRLVDTFAAAEDSTVRDWEQVDFLISGSVSSLTWCYTKNGSTRGGADSGWLDALTFTTPSPVTEQVCLALDMSAEDCALISAVFSLPPSGLMLVQQLADVPWSVSMAVDNRGGSSLRSGDIDHSEASCLVLAVTLPVGTQVRFSLRTNSQGLFDHLTFAADSQTVIERFSAAEGGNLRNWEQLEYIVTNRISNLSWCYQKNDNTSQISDAGWLDTLSFTVPVQLTKTQLCTALDLSTDNCSQIQSVSADPPSFPWRITSDTSVAGGSSLHSAPVGDSDQSCLVLELSLSANSVITLASRSSSQGGFDQLQISADQTRLDTLSAAIGSTEKSWEYTTYYLPTAAAQLRWCYVKHSTTSSGADRVWIDNLSFSAADISYQSRICAALDLVEKICSTVSSISYNLPRLPWIITSQTSVLGGTSLRSADIGDGQFQCLTMLIQLPANTLIRFSVRSDSEAVNDFLSFTAGGNTPLLSNFSAATGSLRDWEPQEFTVSDIIPFLFWCYFKNDSISSGRDSVWLDALSFTFPLTTEDVCLALDLSDEECALITAVATEPPQSLWLISPIATEGGTALRSGDIDDGETSCLVLKITLPEAREARFSLRIDSEAVNDFLYFEAAGTRLIDSFSAPQGATLRDWEQQLDVVISDSISSLKWCYIKNSSTSSGEDAVWVDALSFADPGSEQILPLCAALDFPPAQCATIRSVTYEPPQSPWLTTTTESARGGSALVSPLLTGSGQSSCLTVEFDSPLPADSYAVFAWRTTSQSEQDILQFQAGGQQRQISNVPEWQTEVVDFNGTETTLRWCCSKNSSADSQTNRAWLDNLLIVTPANRYAVQIAVISTSVLLTADANSFRFQVTVTAESTTLPPPSDWELIVSGIDNIATANTAYALVFTDSLAAVEVIATPGDPLLPSSIRLALEDRPVLRDVVITPLTWQLPARRLAQLTIGAPAEVTETAIGAAIEIAVSVTATDNFGRPFEPTGLTLNVAAADQVELAQDSFALTFADGLANALVVVELASEGDAGSIELSVISGELVTTAGVTLNPFPPVLASITLAAVDSRLVQPVANSAVSAELILTALDNYGDPIEAGNLSLQLSASNDAMVPPGITVAIETSGTARQIVEILPQNDLDTTVTVSILRGTLDESVQLPDSGIQIAVRVRRVLRQLQLSLVNQVSPLRQIDRTLPIRANIRLIGLDQFGQPSAFSEVMLTAAAEPMATAAVLEPPQLTATGPEGAVTVLVVTFPEASPVETMITVAIEAPGTGVMTNSLVVQALPDLRDALRPLHVDATETGVTELDLIVALRWLIDQQGDNNASLVVNLTIPSADITADGIDNLQQLFTDPANLDRVDLNRDGRADQLDLRILLRYVAGLRGAQLAEQEVFEDLIRRLLNR